MPFYQQRGELPRKRHIQFRENGTLLTEEVMGLEGFTGNESILYHLHSPCRVKELGSFTPIVRDEWVPDAHAHRLLGTYGVAAGGDPISGRRLLMWNDDVEISLCRPDTAMEYFFRNGEGDELIFVHEGRGTLETIFGDLPYRDGDYVVVPRGTTYRFAPEEGSEQRYLVFETPGLVEVPTRYRNEYGQLLEGAPYSNRDLHPPRELRTHRDRGGHLVTVRVRGGYQEYLLDYHPFDVVGWDGYLYPWKFSIHDFEPIAGRIHQPPPTHQTFQGPGFVVCSFCPRKLDFDPLAIPIPYHHSNLQSEEMIYYVSGNFGSRKGIDVGAITLHPSGLPHGPQPGLAEKSIGVAETTELAVMCDTFRPLRLTTFARDLDDGRYAYSWYEPASGEPSLAGVTSHL
ncbi:MAG TPA: homogentisate 1,2-dioxygenase [Gaiellaceae bacterium]|nr:homogentisate 1,2-dioxygenase [Gaiellaceae bacterium]